MLNMETMPCLSKLWQQSKLNLGRNYLKQP